MLMYGSALSCSGIDAAIVIRRHGISELGTGIPVCRTRSVNVRADASVLFVPHFVFCCHPASFSFGPSSFAHYLSDSQFTLFF